MLFLQLIPFLLLAGPVSARPRLLEHQSSNDVISGMTPTSADRPQTAACTPATLACTAEYVALHGRNCGEIASVHAIQFSDHEVELSSDSKQCERILREYGLCPVHTRTTATPPAFPTFPTNEAQAVLMISPAVAVLIPQDLDLAQSMMVIHTTSKFDVSRLTYTLGLGTSARLRTIAVTHTRVETVTVTSYASPTMSGAGAGA
ncbi:unnamed protein product [Zymoseptoria tritici ST99CH_1A5]|uniref:FAS1 domain-containing protein n=1 Tax=Zymoseptoria tritici ST99CH_1A5 TaxID=1276529 RepID=A0A1Y6L5X1_ZYMTR|nr:unnamed protein product [Zymoseptoria tritici ST99CH_1A5]